MHGICCQKVPVRPSIGHDPVFIKTANLSSKFWPSYSSTLLFRY